MNFIAIALAGFEAWAAKPHNAKWFRRIEGTPIPNDLPVCIAQAFSDALAARLSVPEAGKAVVKPLEWHLSDDSERWVAVRPFGEYIIVRDHRASAETTHGWFNEGRWEWFGSFEAAKTAAQSDYEQRILSALASSPAPTGAEDDSDLPTAEDVRGILGPTKGCPL